MLLSPLLSLAPLLAGFFQSVSGQSSPFPAEWENDFDEWLESYTAPTETNYPNTVGAQTAASRLLPSTTTWADDAWETYVPKQEEFTLPPGGCNQTCYVAYAESQYCGLAHHPADGPDNFNTSCLCSSVDFMQEGPPCIECLLENQVEFDYRLRLQGAYRDCNSLGAPTCPKSCNGIESLVTYCDAVDAGQIYEDGRTVSPNATAPARNPTPCICREGRDLVIMGCVDCINEWNAPMAKGVRDLLKKCTAPTTRRQAVPKTEEANQSTGTSKPSRSNGALKTGEPGSESGAESTKHGLQLGLVSLLGIFTVGQLVYAMRVLGLWVE